MSLLPQEPILLLSHAHVVINAVALRALFLWFSVDMRKQLVKTLQKKKFLYIIIALFFQALAGEKETLSAACWGHSPWPIMSVRDGAATMATSAGGGTGGVGPASPNDHDARSYMLQIYPRLAAQSTTCCNLRWVLLLPIPTPVLHCLRTTKDTPQINKPRSTLLIVILVGFFSLGCKRMQQQPQSSRTLLRHWGWTLAECMC